MPALNPQSPTQQQVALVAQLCRYMEDAEQEPDLATLAGQAGMSRFQVQRVFKAVTGVTPKAWAMAQRARKLRTGLDAGKRVTDAILDAGYTGSRCYAEADRVLGMTPRRYRAGGEGATLHFAIGQCSLGAILVATSERGVCAILLGDDPDMLLRDLQDRFPRAVLVGADADFERSIAAVVGLVENPAKGMSLPLDIRGTAFQQRVWQALQTIPAGSTATYTDIARRIGSPAAVRAVASACAANPLAVAIPCHRVVRHDGGLAGYRWGLARKRALLLMEGAGLDGHLDLN